MNKLFSIFTIFIFTITLQANTLIDEILNEFNIPNNEKNKEIVLNIEKSIDERDIGEFIKIIKSSPDNVYMVKKELEKIDAPEFLLYLAMVESKFLNRATSSKKAGGMWQFMPGTAKSFGLNVNAQIDERRDPFLSTDTAFKYLDFLNESFEDKWYISLMAYNCGDGCIKKVIRNNKNDDFSTLLTSNKTPKETKNFIKRIIKNRIISKNIDVRVALVNLKPKNSVEKIKVQSGTSLASVGNSIGLSIDEMKKYNPHIKTLFAPKDQNAYHFYIPEEKLNLYALNYIGQIIRGENTFAPSYNIHVVAKDDTIESIAKKWNIQIDELIKENDLSDDLKVGRKLKIPTSIISFNDNKEYTIKKGDTLVAISNKFDVDMATLVAANEIKDLNIKVGDTIVIP
ncbi:MAG: LysM peptidoglycan-binding domain-containing protein [Campylobacter ureolyticus]|nr:lytic transglycosylase domain-containing protein [Campylobacter ureolyticus]MDK8323625.1 LysM peptidoglycan-binding domain-containing protein [Campylobacter ureolyticus]